MWQSFEVEEEESSKDDIISVAPSRRYEPPPPPEPEKPTTSDSASQTDPPPPPAPKPVEEDKIDELPSKNGLDSVLQEVAEEGVILPNSISFEIYLEGKGLTVAKSALKLARSCK